MRRADRAESRRSLEAALVQRSREAIAQSFAVLAKVPELVGTEAGSEAPRRAGLLRHPAAGGASPWQALLAEGLGARFFFDIDDGERVRHDACGMVLSSPDDIPRETEAVLFDLAHAEIPSGRPRVFFAKVRDAQGTVVYEGSMTMRPLSTD